MNHQSNQATLPRLRDPFQTLFSRLFGEQLPELYGNGDGVGASVPRTNIAENENEYELSFELPGLDEKDIDVNLHDHTLTVSAQRQDRRENDGKRWHRVEHRYGEFSRSIQLPQDATAQGIQAVYQKGVLTVTVPKAPESKPTKVQVRGG